MKTHAYVDKVLYLQKVRVSFDYPSGLDKKQGATSHLVSNEQKLNYISDTFHNCAKLQYLYIVTITFSYAYHFLHRGGSFSVTHIVPPLSYLTHRIMQY